MVSLDQIVAKIGAAALSPRRRVIAIEGPPASGKSTLAETLAKRCKGAVVLPMDGFHLDNRLLEEQGLLPRKGAPETFDLAGFVHLLGRLQDEDEVVFPLFDRTRDIAIAGAGQIKATCHTVIIEGNYLLFDHLGWRDLASHWSLSINLSPAHQTLKDRLVKRWINHGLNQAEAEERADRNDMVNADLIRSQRLPADLEVAEI